MAKSLIVLTALVVAAAALNVPDVKPSPVNSIYGQRGYPFGSIRSNQAQQGYQPQQAYSAYSDVTYTAGPSVDNSGKIGKF